MAMSVDHELTLWVGATRYYLGRQTYAVEDFCNLLIGEWPSLSSHTKQILMRDINEEFRRDDDARANGAEHKPLGHDCDRKSWARVRNLWV